MAQLIHKHVNPLLPYLSFCFLLLLFSSFQGVHPKQTKDLCEKIRESLLSKDQSKVNNALQEAQKRQYDACFLELVPKYYWAQNMTHIMVQFQFLNSADTSACDRVLSVQKNIGHDWFAISLICTQSSILIRYRLKVRTLMAMNYYHAVWKQGHQNTINLECLKSPTPYFWKSLYDPKHIPTRRPKVWWKIMEKYQQDLKNYIYDLEVEDQETDISAEVKRQRQHKNLELFEEYAADSSKYFVNLILLSTVIKTIRFSWEVGLFEDLITCYNSSSYSLSE